MKFVTHIEINIDFIQNIIWNPISGIRLWRIPAQLRPHI